jgi:hypothetical protein
MYGIFRVNSGTKYLDRYAWRLENMFDKILSIQNLWQILFPVAIIGILIGAYKNMKNAKLVNPNDDEPDEFNI